MPKFTDKKARVHFNLFESEYQKLLAFANQNSTTASNVVRMLIRTLLKDIENPAAPKPTMDIRQNLVLENKKPHIDISHLNF